MKKMRACIVLTFLLVFAIGLSAMAKQTDGALSGNILNGGLAAVCLIMLWIYFCTIILLLGAEVNKLFFVWQKRRKKVVSV